VTKAPVPARDGDHEDDRVRQGQVPRSGNDDDRPPASLLRSDDGIKVGQPYDLMTVPMWYAQRMIVAGIVRPLDVSKLTEWKTLFPGLAKNSLILGKSGTVYGAPIAWGDGPFVYNPKLVSNPPTSLLEYLKPQWAHKYVLFNSNAIMDTLALEDGYKNAPLLTKAQFNVVTNQATTLVKNAQAFTTSKADQTSPAGHVWSKAQAGRQPLPMYSATAGAPMDAQALAVSGGSVPHNNMMPYLTLTFIIALQGVYPPRS